MRLPATGDTMPIQIKRGHSIATDPKTAVREIYDAIYDASASLIIVYCSPSYDRAELGAALCECFGRDAPVIGCTTAAEISPRGYLEDSLTAVSLGGDGLVAFTERMDDLRNLTLVRGEQAADLTLQRMRRRGLVPSGDTCFGFLLVDGLSMQEEIVVSSIYSRLEDIQLFGGSAADGVEFRATHLYHDGQFHSDCALFTLFHTTLPFRVFKTAHFVASDQKMVITGADPARRVVTEINGAPAGREYARMVGLELDKLTPLIFAAYPVVVSVGNVIYVRSIQKVNEDESLTFFCAIDEGIVLTVARGVDMVRNLEESLALVTRDIGVPSLILGCDCILRYIEMNQKGIRDRINDLYAAHNVIGFATYGEQFNAMHVNQTFTGVAIGSE
jgi:hypothetical protein